MVSRTQFILFLALVLFGLSSCGTSQRSQSKTQTTTHSAGEVQEAKEGQEFVALHIELKKENLVVGEANIRSLSGKPVSLKLSEQNRKSPPVQKVMINLVPELEGERVMIRGVMSEIGGAEKSIELDEVVNLGKVLSRSMDIEGVTYQMRITPSV